MFYKLLKKEWIFVIFLTILAFSIYAFSLKGDFLHMDDTETIVNSPFVNNISAALQTKNPTVIINSFIKSKFGDNPIPFHVKSVFLHLVNSVMAFFIVKQLFGKKAAILASILFVIHPSNTEAVSWLSASVYLMQAFFWLLSILFFILYKEKNRIIFLIVSYLSVYTYAFTTKSAWSVCIPLILTTLDVFVINNGKYSFKKAKLVLPYYLSLVYYAIFVFSDAIKLRVADLQTYYVGVAPQNRVISMLRVVKNSFGLYLFPYKLNVLFGDYQPTTLNVLILFMFFAALVYLLIYFFKNDKKLFGLLACLYLSVLPLFSPVSIGIGYAERYFYFGTLFFSAFIVLFVLNIEKITNKKNLAFIIFSFVFVLFSFRTVIRTLDWKNDLSIWTAAKAMSPNSYEIYNELGNIYYRDDSLQEALVNYQKALEIRPNYPEVIHNVGLVYIKAGQLDLAKNFLERSLQMNPSMYESYYRLGQIAAYEKQYDLAAKYFTESLKINPEFDKAKLELSKLR